MEITGTGRSLDLTGSIIPPVVQCYWTGSKHFLISAVHCSPVAPSDFEVSNSNQLPGVHGQTSISRATCLCILKYLLITFKQGTLNKKTIEMLKI